MRNASTTSASRAVLALVAAAAGASALVASPEPGRRGGRLVMALRAEPETLNPTLAVTEGALAVVHRIHASLVGIDRRTLEPEPALAESWTASADGRVLELELRRGVRFSDGEAFDSEDVVWTFRVLLDPANASPLRGNFVLGGEQVQVRATGSHSVRFEMATPRAAAVRMLADVAVLPSHVVRPLQQAGEWPRSWGVTTPGGAMPGLGPFRLARREPGSRLVLERNPHYWKRGSAGVQLPYLDELEFLIVSSEDAQVMRFRAGETDLINSLGPANFRALQGQAELHDVGPSLEYSFLFFNLNELGERGSPLTVRHQRWFRQRAFRQAVSRAVDRAGIARLVFQNHAAPLASHESPANTQWWSASLRPLARDLDAARALLRGAGFSWDGGGQLIDGDRSRVRFSILVSAGATTRRFMATLIQQDLAELGLTVDVVPMDHRALLARVLRSFDYDAALLELGPQDGDPMAHYNVLVSDGGTHLWQMAGRATTEWETRLDSLMRRQVVSLDGVERKDLYDQVQELVARELPFIPLVSPHLLVAVRPGLGNFRPSVLPHAALWNADQLFWRAPR